MEKAICAAGVGIAALALGSCKECPAERPNVIIILTDDVGYGDIGCYGSTTINTPEIDAVALSGLRFSDAHSTSATSTPSRYGMLTGQYPWRVPGTGVANGDAGMVIKPGANTLASVMQQSGYETGVVGKWHLGLGETARQQWNDFITPGPLDIGFGYSFIMAATGDRVPCVYIEDQRIYNWDADHPVEVSYKENFAGEPTGRDNPELLKLHPSHGHDMAIVNGISRIGYMRGGGKALWEDEQIADVITSKAVGFIEQNRDKPFFLYFGTNDIHVPRAPHERFAGKSGMGPRGDAILSLDWSVGEIMKTLRRLELDSNTIVIITSDNGPVVDDGYADMAQELLGKHRPWGDFRGGKYSAFEAGTRVPFIVHWPAGVTPGVSKARVSQIDIFASLTKLCGATIPAGAAPDSRDASAALTGLDDRGREWIVEQNVSGTLSLVYGSWKYIEPGGGPQVAWETGIETGNDPTPQLYNLNDDIGERNNIAARQPDRLGRMSEMLGRIRSGGPEI